MEEQMFIRPNANWRAGLALTIAASVLLIAGCGGSKSLTSSLPSNLTSAGPLLEGVMKGVPGLTQQQAILGTGALLGHAKANMSADEFAKVAEAVPGTNELVDAATKQGVPGN